MPGDEGDGGRGRGDCEVGNRGCYGEHGGGDEEEEDEAGDWVGKGGEHGDKECKTSEFLELAGAAAPGDSRYISEVVVGLLC